MGAFFDETKGGAGTPALAAAFPLWVEATSAWCAAIRDEVALETALTELLAAAGAEAGMIVRTRRQDGHQYRLALSDRMAAGAMPLRQSYAAQAFGHHLEYARVGTVWVQSACDPVEAETLANFQESRQLRDLVVLVLSSGPSLRDHIELHFRHPVDPDMQGLFGGVMTVLARNWAGHNLTLDARPLAGPATLSRMPARQEMPNMLAPSNPARLSRAEFRVCLLLSRGLSVQGVCDALELTEATIRSHLRNIYAKSGAAGLVELVYLLTSDTRADAPMPLSRSA